MTIYRVYEKDFGTRICRKATTDKKEAELYLKYMISCYRRAWIEAENE